MSVRELFSQMSDSAEFQSGLVRLAIWVFAATYVGLSSMTEYYLVDADNYVALFSVYLVLFLAIFTSVLIRPEWVARRYVTLMVDVTATSFAIYLTGHATSPFFILYFWIFLSYGTRYGKNHLFAASLASATAYLITVSAMDGWTEYGFEASFVLLSLILLPLYQFSLLRRLRDVTQQAQLSRRKAEASNQAKSSFLANMSHEIRTPLNGLMSMGQLLLGTRLDRVQQEYTENLVHSCRALSTVINEVLDFSKIEAGVLEIKPYDFSLRALLDDVMQLMRFTAEAKSLGLEYRCPAEIPDRLHGDASRVRQVLLNIIGNALRFTEAGEVVTKVELTARDAGDMRLHFSVIDTGIGIREEQQAKLFERFTQLDDTPSRTHGGTGLGLAISRHLIEAMGGIIGVESEYGRGSTFWFELPLAVAKNAVASAGAEVEQISLQGLLVLLVDDDAINRLAGQRILEQAGCVVTLASDGEEALTVLGQRQVDLVLMDIHMPRLDGIEATRRIRESWDRGECHMPIIGLTASVMKDEQEQYLAAGMDDVVAKPVEIGVLTRAMQTAIGRHLPAALQRELQPGLSGTR
jgi:two-component system sensor histidine kinase RpfC